MINTHTRMIRCVLRRITLHGGFSLGGGREMITEGFPVVQVVMVAWLGSVALGIDRKGLDDICETELTL